MSKNFCTECIASETSAVGLIGSPNATLTGWRFSPLRLRLREGQNRPGGIASCVPDTRIGTIHMRWRAASTAAPRRTRPVPPDRDRVPSGYSSRLQPWSSNSSTCSARSLSSPPPQRSIGTVLKISETSIATSRLR